MHYLFSVSVVTPRGRKEKTRSKQKQQLVVKGEMASINFGVFRNSNIYAETLICSSYLDFSQLQPLTKTPL